MCSPFFFMFDYLHYNSILSICFPATFFSINSLIPGHQIETICRATLQVDLWLRVVQRPATACARKHLYLQALCSLLHSDLCLRKSPSMNLWPSGGHCNAAANNHIYRLEMKISAAVICITKMCSYIYCSGTAWRRSGYQCCLTARR